MSGICGIVALSSAVDTRVEFPRMLGALARFEHHTVRHCHLENASLGIVSNNAQARRGALTAPFEVGPWTFVANARLDNRSSAIDAMSQTTRAMLDNATDEQIVAQAVVHEPLSTLASIWGDWIISGWNHEQETLQIVREPYGGKTLFYVQTPDIFAFSSSLASLLALKCVQFEIDEFQLARNLTQWGAQTHETIFKGISFLPPAYSLTCKQGTVTITRYWKMESSTKPLRIDYREAVEEMRRQMSRAVEVRTSDAGPVASMLSSGLDSSSVAALASRALAATDRTLDTYCSSPLFSDQLLAQPGRFGDETPLARMIAQGLPNARFVSCNSSDVGPVEGIERTVDATSEPRYATSNDHWAHSLFSQVARDGNERILHGGLGNVTFSWGLTRTQSLARMLRFGDRSGLRYRAIHLPPAVMLRTIRSKRRFDGMPWRSFSPISSAFTDRIRLLERMLDEGHNPAIVNGKLLTGLQMRVDDINPQFGGGVLWEMLSQRYGLEVLDPTADTELILFTLALRENTFTGPTNEPRWLAKQAAKHWLPSQIIDNPERGLQAADLTARLLREHERVEEWFDRLSQTPLAAEVLDLPRMKEVWVRLRSEKTPKMHKTAWSILLNGFATGIFINQFVR